MDAKRALFSILLFLGLFFSATVAPADLEITFNSDNYSLSRQARVLTGSAESNRFSGLHLVETILSFLEAACQEKHVTENTEGADPKFRFVISHDFEAVGLPGSPIRRHLLHRILLI